MNPCNGMISPPAPKTPGNHGRYRHIHLGAYVLAHHVSFQIRLMRIAHSHNVLDSKPPHFGASMPHVIISVSYILEERGRVSLQFYLCALH